LRLLMGSILQLLSAAIKEILSLTLSLKLGIETNK